MTDVHYRSLSVFAVALFGAFISTPYFIKLCFARGILDLPGPRRINKRPVARMGGPAMYLGFMAALGVSSLWLDNLLPLAAAATVVFITGVLDDMKGLRPALKLAGQFVGALIICRFWNRIDGWGNPFGGYINFPPWVAYTVTIFWIVGITNTLNLIDGLDGLAAGITCIASATFFLVSLEKGQYGSAILSASLVGATAGFLRWNFYPAKTFMGDSGALFLGFVLSSIAVNGAFKGAAALTFLLPVLALGVPIFDTSFAIIRRVSAGQPVMSAPDKGHVHHRLIAAGWLHRDAVILIYAITLCLSVMALLIIGANMLALYLVAAIASLTLLVLLLGKYKRGKPDVTKIKSL